MTDNSDAGAPGDRPKRAPPTIDLDPSDVKADVDPRTGEQQQDRARKDARRQSMRGPSFENASQALTPALSGATAAALILLGAWLLGLSGDNRTPASAPAPVDTTAIDALRAKVAKLEADVQAKPPASSPPLPAPDPATTSRIERIDAAMNAMNETIASLRSDLERAAAAKPAEGPRAAEAAPAVDLSALDQRFARIETAQRALSETAQRTINTDDRLLRRAIVAGALGLAVNRGDPFASALNAAKALASDVDLKPLDPFAFTGVPGDATLIRELLALTPKLQPAEPKAPASAGGAGLMERLQESAAKLVRVERTDLPPGPPAVTPSARLVEAARLADISAAVAAFADLPADQRAIIQSWRDRVALRDQARETARQFAANALAALGKSGP